MKALLGATGVTLAICAWQLAAWLIDSDAVPGPSATVAALAQILGEQRHWTATLDTFVMVVRGLLAALAVGVLIGTFAGSSARVATALSVPMEFLKPIPPIVVLPIMVLAVGPTRQMGELLVFLGCVLPIAYTTTNGVRDTDPIAVQTARSYGLTHAQILRRVVLPSTAAFVGTAVRIALPHAFVISVIAGYLGGSPGLGLSIAESVVSGENARLYAVVIVLGWLGLLVYELGYVLERRLLHWHPSYRQERA